MDSEPNGSLFGKSSRELVDLEANGWFMFFDVRLLLNKRAGLANLVVDPLANLSTQSVREVGSNILLFDWGGNSEKR